MVMLNVFLIYGCGMQSQCVLLLFSLKKYFWKHLAEPSYLHLPRPLSDCRELHKDRFSCAKEEAGTLLKVL